MNGFSYHRRKAGLTQAEAADLLGVDQTAVSSWECGKKFPRSSKLLHIAAVYRCGVEDLFREYPKY